MMNNDIVYVPLLTRYIPFIEKMDAQEAKELILAICNWFCTGKEVLQFNNPNVENWFNLISKDTESFRKTAKRRIASRTNGQKGGAPIGNKNALKYTLNTEYSSRLNDDKAQMRTIAYNSRMSFQSVRTNLRAFMRECERNNIEFSDYYTFCEYLENFCCGEIRFIDGKIEKQQTT